MSTKSPVGPKVVHIDALSVTSLYLKLYVNGQHLSYGTGIVVLHQGRPFLVTAGHVLTGRHAETGELLSKKTGAFPDQVRVALRFGSQVGGVLKWRFVRFPLYDRHGKPLWLTHPAGREVDIVALELTKMKPDIEIYPFDLSLADVDLLAYPAMAVSVIGFPLGLRPNNFFPIWKTGHIATDPELDYREILPAFLIDATTREGMSGSPVVVRSPAGYLNSQRIWVMGGSNPTKFLGMYSGRIHGDSEIGIVWRPHVITEVLATVNEIT